MALVGQGHHRTVVPPVVPLEGNSRAKKNISGHRLISVGFFFHGLNIFAFDAKKRPKFG
jgi:hypothetical protein